MDAGKKSGFGRRVRGPVVSLMMALLLAGPVRAGAEEDRWWPTQALPTAIVRTTNQQEFAEPKLALQM